MRRHSSMAARPSERLRRHSSMAARQAVRECGHSSMAARQQETAAAALVYGRWAVRNCRGGTVCLRRTGPWGPRVRTKTECTWSSVWEQQGTSSLRDTPPSQEVSPCQCPVKRPPAKRHRAGAAPIAARGGTAKGLCMPTLRRGEARPSRGETPASQRPREAVPPTAPWKGSDHSRRAAPHHEKRGVKSEVV